MANSGEILSAESEKTLAKPHWFVTLGMSLLFLILLWVEALVAGIAAAIVAGAHFFLSDFEVYFGTLIPFSALIFLVVFLPSATLSAIECFGYRRNYRFSLRKEFIYTRQGTVLKTHSLIPYENIQDVQLDEGFFERLTGTASLRISTPASGTSVPMVERGLAETLKKEILDLAEKHRGLAE